MLGIGTRLALIGFDDLRQNGHDKRRRLAAAIALLRAEYRSRVPLERLAAEAGMSLISFHKHFKQ